MDTEWIKIETVQKMQDYIRENIFKDSFALYELYSHGGYSANIATEYL